MNRNRKYSLKARDKLNGLKSNGCAICGYNKSIRALHFHHVNPEDRKFSIIRSNLIKKSANIFVEEINKCVLLCCNCHMEIEEKQEKL